METLKKVIPLIVIFGVFLCFCAPVVFASTNANPSAFWEHIENIFLYPENTPFPHFRWSDNFFGDAWQALKYPVEIGGWLFGWLGVIF